MGRADTPPRPSPPAARYISDAKLKQLYATMVECRLLTERVCRLRGKPGSAGLCCFDRPGGHRYRVLHDLQPEDTIALPPQNAIAALVKGALG